MQNTKLILDDLINKSSEELKDRLLNILSTKSYKEGKFILASGKESTFYLDGKLSSLDAEGGALISLLFLRLLKPEVSDVGGITMGADPLASGVSQIGFLLGKNINAFYIRKESKGHGTNKFVEGPLVAGSNVAILEDVVTTGGSSLKAIERVTEYGCKVIQVLAIVDRNQGGKEAFANLGIDYQCLFDISQIQERYKKLKN